MKTNKLVGRSPLMIPVSGERRAALNRIRARAAKFGFKPSDVRIKTLLLYALLENNKSSLTFKTSEETQQYDIEIRLEKSDAFYCDRMAFGIHKVLVSGTTRLYANSETYYYPDRNWFGLANEARDLEGLYNSVLEIKTDQDVRLEELTTRHFRKAPEQQYNSTAGNVAQTIDKWVNIQSNLGIWGNKRTELTVKYGPGSYAAIAGDPADGTDPHENYAVLELDGFEIVRGAEAITVSDANMIFQGI